MRGARIVVAGGGLAGIAAAVEAAGLGARVTLVERRPFLGGKAFSFTDPRTGAEIDNGQHVHLGCCTAYISLLDRLGSIGLTAMQPALRVDVRDRAGTHGVLIARRLPAPLHMGPSFARYGLLSPAERVRAARALTAIAALGPAGRDALDHVAFGEWLRAHGQRDAAIERFWDVVILPTCNDRSDRVSAALAMFVITEGLMRTRGGASIGWALAGLSHLVDAPARRLLQREGGRVVSGHAVTSADAGGVDLDDGTRLEADAVVLALPPGRARAVAPGALPVDPALGESPIVNVHLWYDRPVLDRAVLAVVDSPVQWMFDRTAITGEGAPGQHLALSLSAARAEMGVPRPELAEHMDREVRKLLPARNAVLQAWAVTKDARATFAPSPGQAARRPAARTPVQGLVLAGTWTATGWPATMEGAVRSGLAAVHEAARQMGGERA
ncbi:MAG: FAD-dependent oxidoreductase [Thermoleophilia bacterium]|nr:FAD-dependent oxidoreductase [Thermoleophilia bacterium]